MAVPSFGAATTMPSQANDEPAAAGGGKNMVHNKQGIDMLHGRIWTKVLRFALPVAATGILEQLFNASGIMIVGNFSQSDGTAAVAAVGSNAPVTGLILNLFIGIALGANVVIANAIGRGSREAVRNAVHTSIVTALIGGVIVAIIGELLAGPLLGMLNVTADVFPLALAYLRIYLIGTPLVMLATGMNGFINAQGYSTVGMLSVTIGAVANLLLDPLFIFVFGFGVQGAAIATVISQTLSAVFVLYFLTRKSELKVRFVRKDEISECAGYAKNIVSLGTAGFIMQLTNSLVTICCNNVLSVTGGDIYISVMTIVSSVRQLVETPIYAMNEGTSPILSYNYGARRPARVRKAMCVMSAMILGYTAVMWSVIVLAPHALIGIFSSDAVLTADAVPALKQYFAAFIFMDLQYIGQTVFKSLNKKKQAIFFSLLRKVFIVVPLTYLMPYVLHMGTDGVFLAEPVSNVIGGSLCFITMLILVLPELKRMEQQK